VDGVLGASAVAVARPVGGCHRINGTGLGEHGFLVFAAVVAVFIEMRDEAAVLIVFASIQPERKQLGRKVLPALFEARGYFFSIDSHFAILSIGRSDIYRQQVQVLMESANNNKNAP
jgi:hypothetical protein